MDNLYRTLSLSLKIIYCLVYLVLSMMAMSVGSLTQRETIYVSSTTFLGSDNHVDFKSTTLLMTSDGTKIPCGQDIIALL